ncbi:hypothetical protein GCM10027052_10340 [Parafrigoribacterium mesophilum]|uniref:DUF1684 domain-containing protein n=1 Tax=Parafrigoribacterium mesophilum TaxID=433646 RepID=UPI0031FDBBB8
MENSWDAANIVDWRLRVFELYAQVRELSADDPAAAHSLWRDGRDELFATHPSSPLLPEHRATFTGLTVADYDPAWRFDAVVEPAQQPQRLEVETGTDGVVPFDLLGTVRLRGIGSLDVWRLAGYAGGIFLPVRDGLAGRPGGTYGGGRYLLDTIKGAYLGPGAAAGDFAAISLVLDFNFAYNPSCAYDPAWACPLPQAGNRLTTAVPVGELSFGAGY